MIVNDEEANLRIESPMNLLNRLRDLESETHNKVRKNQIVSIPPSSDEIIDDLEEKIRSNSAKSKATSIMLTAMAELEKRIPIDNIKPEKLSHIISDMAKVVSSQNRDNNNGKDSDNKPQYIIYAPQIISEQHFDVIDLQSKEA